MMPLKAHHQTKRFRAMKRLNKVKQTGRRFVRSFVGTRATQPSSLAINGARIGQVLRKQKSKRDIQDQPR